MIEAMELNERERKIIDILVNHEISPDAFGAPILAVDRAMGWATKESLKFVNDLVDRKLVRPDSLGREGQKYGSKWQWKEGNGS